jgi:hypothetical protein
VVIAAFRSVLFSIFEPVGSEGGVGGKAAADEESIFIGGTVVLENKVHPNLEESATVDER